MTNKETMPYAPCPMPFLVFILCCPLVSAQETPADDDPLVVEMMNDKEFQKFLRTTGQAFPTLTVQTEPIVREKPDNLSLYRRLRQQQDEENERNRDTIGYKRREYDFHFPKQSQRLLSVGVKIDMRQGVLRETGEEFDLGIEGNGFFQVIEQEEPRIPPEILYTRCGSFERDPEGFLSLIQGERVFRLTPQIFIPAEMDSLHVSEDGQIRAITGADVQTIGRLELAVFPNPRRLCPVDDRCFSATPLSGKPKIQTTGTGKTRQRFLEEANE